MVRVLFIWMDCEILFLSIFMDWELFIRMINLGFFRCFFFIIYIGLVVVSIIVIIMRINKVIFRF